MGIARTRHSVANWRRQDCGHTIRRTILYSVVSSDQILQTQDDFATIDLSGITNQQVLVHADLDELLSLHRERLASCFEQKRTFSTGTTFSDWESIRRMRVEQMARMGLAKFTNREESVYRHTLKGAWLQYYRGFRRQLAEGKNQAERIHKKRPGDT